MSTIRSFPFKANLRGFGTAMLAFLASTSVSSPFFSLRAKSATSIMSDGSALLTLVGAAALVSAAGFTGTVVAAGFTGTDPGFLAASGFDEIASGF